MARLLTVEGHWRTDITSARGRRELESGLVFTTPRRWYRLAAFYGEAPGSRMMDGHFTVWRTRYGIGELSGINIRFGWWPEPCVTLLAHTHPARDYGQ
jgi:hypothetical protein